MIIPSIQLTRFTISISHQNTAKISQMNRLYTLLTLLSAVVLISGHTYVADFNGKNTCVRPSGANSHEDSPLYPSDFLSPNFQCNIAGKSAKPSCPVSAGDEVSVTYIHDPSTANDVIDISHKGPCMGTHF